MNSRMLTPQQFAEVANLLHTLTAPATHTPTPAIAPGDVVQIRPTADAAFGGMLAQICQVRPYELRGFLLRPHRGGCREAWLRLKPTDVDRIGSAPASDVADFARRCEDRGPHCTALLRRLTHLEDDQE